MVYFNYFIKCIIRRFVRLFFTKKTFIFLLVLSLLFFFSFKSFAYGASDGLLLTPVKQFYYYNSVRLQLTSSSRFASGNSNFTSSSFFVYKFLSGHTYKISTTSSFQVFSCFNLDNFYQDGYIYPNSSTTQLTESWSAVDYYTLLFSDAQIISSGSDCYYLVKETDYISHNFKVFEIDTTLSGVPSEVNVSYSNTTLYMLTTGMITSSSDPADANSYVARLQPNTDYTISYSTSVDDGTPRLGFSSSYPVPNTISTDYQRLPSGTSTYSFNSGNNFYLIFSYRKASLKFFSLTTVSSSGGLNQSIDNLDNSIQEGSDKINSTLTDSNLDISTDLPTDNTQDITESGFNSIFTTIRNTFTSSSSQDLVLVIPFTGKSFTINFTNVYRWF